MPIRVFVSHANADQEFVDEFVDVVLFRGLELKSTDVFYSSGADTGVPDGDDLLHHVRDRVSEPTVVITLVTPMFLTRPVCIAELGAAWAQAGKLFPLLAPGIDRSAVEGVLVGVQTPYANDPAALDRLHDRITDGYTGPSAATWGAAKHKWLARVDKLAEALKIPVDVSASDHAHALADNASLQEALRQSEEEIASLKETVRALHTAKTAAEADEAILPADDIGRFEELLRDADRAMTKLDTIVREAVRYDLAGKEMPLSNDSDWDWADRLARADDAGYLNVDYEGGAIYLNEDFPDIEVALGFGRRLRHLLETGEPEFQDWFRDEYRVPPRITLAAFRAMDL